MLLKSIKTPFGANVGYHRVVRIEIDASNAEGYAMVQVSSWPDEEAFITHDRMGPTFNWYIPVPMTVLSGPDLVASCESALASMVYTENPLAGASIVPMASDLEAERVKRWGNIKQTRELMATSPIVWDGSTFDADQTSQGLITGAIRGMELSGQPTINWTLSDNSVRQLTLDELRAVGLAILARIDACYGIARQLREQINAATTLEEVLAVTWPVPASPVTP